ncbi:hypothetical protein [Corynebacterium flavescens]|uniref:Uncharacterized protein n=1 Tax=Corynebacterium flavescens TaxID=28028 RepID=A0A1L7CNL1_CORFL|nr:hypothetical protein [Corynebacterium flavescens]APT87411.1 hypothetical protein CFLV_09640 [Corynebacterium flavescens]KAA8720499.1 hypothetical protein F4V60_09375 [Corynebacterium flavescens]GEB97735.1 hypothetical protein CFL01nite_12300 [Corynebacterium flavescens]
MRDILRYPKDLRGLAEDTLILDSNGDITEAWSWVDHSTAKFKLWPGREKALPAIILLEGIDYLHKKQALEKEQA